MPNKIYAQEWLDHSKRNLETAVLLLKEKHYTDIIAFEVHQSIEKLFKAVLAYNGIKIPKTHNLIELHNQCEKSLSFNIDLIDTLVEINDYYEA